MELALFRAVHAQNRTDAALLTVRQRDAGRRRDRKRERIAVFCVVDVDRADLDGQNRTDRLRIALNLDGVRRQLDRGVLGLDGVLRRQRNRQRDLADAQNRYGYLDAGRLAADVGHVDRSAAAVDQGVFRADVRNRLLELLCVQLDDRLGDAVQLILRSGDVDRIRLQLGLADFVSLRGLAADFDLDRHRLGLDAVDRDADGGRIALHTGHAGLRQNDLIRQIIRSRRGDRVLQIRNDLDLRRRQIGKTAVLCRDADIDRGFRTLDDREIVCDVQIVRPLQLNIDIAVFQRAGRVLLVHDIAPETDCKNKRDDQG